MPAVANPNSDFFLIDNLEAITVRPSSSEAGVEVEHAKRRAIQTKEAAASGGKYLTSDVRWHFHRDEYPTPPLPSYQVIDSAGTVWTAIDVERATWDHRWRLICRDLIVQERLDSRITIQLAAHRKGQAGDDMPAWADWKTGLLANITLDRIDRRLDTGIRTDNAQYSITLGESVDFSVADASDFRVVDTGGRIYQVISFERHERIEFLPLLFCEALGPFGSA